MREMLRGISVRNVAKFLTGQRRRSRISAGKDSTRVYGIGSFIRAETFSEAANFLVCFLKVVQLLIDEERKFVQPAMSDPTWLVFDGNPTRPDPPIATPDR